jgi:hypothetical protein
MGESEAVWARGLGGERLVTHFCFTLTALDVMTACGKGGGGTQEGTQSVTTARWWVDYYSTTTGDSLFLFHPNGGGEP